MKRFLIYAVSFAIGGAAPLISASYLFPHWFALGRRSPVAAWLSRHTIVWDLTPEWALAAILGLTLGLALRRKAITPAGFAAVGFVSIPHIWMIVEGTHPWKWFPVKTAVTVELWHGIAVPIMLVGVSIGWLGVARRPKQDQWPVVQFSLRSILYAVTVVAVVLALFRCAPLYAEPLVHLGALTAVAVLRLRRGVAASQ